MRQRFTRPLVCCGTASLALAFCASLASAQVVVVRLDPAAQPVSEALESGLDDWGVTPDPGYYDEAMREGLNPASDDALERLIPPLRARLALVPRSGDDTAVLVEFRDGSTGASLGDATIPLEAGGLGEAGHRALDSEIRGRLGAPRAAASGSEAETTAAESGAESSLRPLLRVYGGLGLGTRSFDWPGASERLAVDMGFFPALDAGIRFMVGIGNTFALGAAFAYQTSFATEIEEAHLAGQPDTLRVRAHRFDATFETQIGHRDGFQVTPGVGVATHNLRPEVHHLRTPSYSLVGPVLRVGFRIPLGPLALRVAPEAQWLFTDDPLVEIGVSGSGPALGGELALQFPIARTLALEVASRGVRAWLPARDASKATDTGFFATTRLVWQP